MKERGTENEKRKHWSFCPSRVYELHVSTFVDRGVGRAGPSFIYSGEIAFVRPV